MKLYNVNLSPFASRVRLQIYAKGLDVALVDPPGGLGSDEYKKVNPTGRTPALQLDDGTIIAESDAICEYLEDRFPEPALRPADLTERARMRMVARFADNYIVPPTQVLFGQVDPATQDRAVIQEQLTKLGPLYDVLDGLLTPKPFAVGATLSLADCVLMPFFFFTTRLHPLLGDQDPTATRRNLRHWWEGVQGHTATKKVDAELAKALAEFMARPR